LSDTVLPSHFLKNFSDTDLLKLPSNTFKATKAYLSLEDIKKIQKQLSEQMKEMMKKLKEGNKPGKEGNNGKNGIPKALAKMSAQQTAIKEKLKKLNNQQKKQGNKGLGDLKSLINDLEKNELSCLSNKLLMN